MSDTFDPDAWPHTPSGAGSAPRQDDQYARPADDDDDDYDTLDLSSTSAASYEDDDDDYDSSTFAGNDAKSEVDDYPISDYDEDYDYGTGSSAPAAGATADYDDDDSGDDSGYGNYDSYDDDEDSYNDYDDFDDDGGKSGGALKKLLIVGGAVVVVLIIAIAALSLGGGSKKNNTATKSTNTTASTAAAATQGTPATPTDDVTNALTQSLTAWGKFAVDGNLDDVRQNFVNSGPQFQRFEAEAPGIQASPPGGAPLAMTMKSSKTNQVDDNNWIISGVVTVARDGNTPQTFNWEIRLQRANAQQPWQILSVRQV